MGDKKSQGQMRKLIYCQKKEKTCIVVRNKYFDMLGVCNSILEDFAESNLETTKKEEK
jgi:hypothetical protein